MRAYSKIQKHFQIQSFKVPLEFPIPPERVFLLKQISRQPWLLQVDGSSGCFIIHNFHLYIFRFFKIIFILFKETSCDYVSCFPVKYLQFSTHLTKICILLIKLVLRLPDTIFSFTFLNEPNESHHHLVCAVNFQFSRSSKLIKIRFFLPIFNF